MSALMFGSLFGLVGRPGAWIAGLAALSGLTLLFVFVSPGGYRHEALWIVFLIALYWITIDGRQNSPVFSAVHRADDTRSTLVSNLGRAAFLGLLGIQVVPGFVDLNRLVHGGPPLSRSRDFARLVEGNPQFRHAVVVADPDYLVEPLAYYLSNPTFLMREHRYGQVVTYTQHAQVELSLTDILNQARQLKSTTGQPVLILLQARLDQVRTAAMIDEGFNWRLKITPPEALAFKRATTLLAQYGQALSDESFDVYVLR